MLIILLFYILLYDINLFQLAVDFLFCLVLIEILKQLNFHPGYDDLIDKIIQMSFSHFKLNDRLENVSTTNGLPLGLSITYHFII